MEGASCTREQCGQKVILVRRWQLVGLERWTVSSPLYTSGTISRVSVM
jgi:hypothetical protein